MEPLLNVEDIHTYYDQSHILFGVNFKINEGEVVFLLGRNGVGKTTTMKSIMGMPSPREGRITYDSQTISGLPTYQIARKGITLVPEGRRILGGLTVAENLEIATRAVARGVSKWPLERIYTFFPIIEERKKQEAITLSGGQQQMLAIARGLMCNPRVLLVDEPFEGLDPLMAKAVLDILVELKAEGVTMLCVDDDTKAAARVADRVYFMDQGKMLWDGPMQDAMKNDQEIAKKYLGVG